MTEKIDTSWNSSILSNKSWVELIEEEEEEQQQQYNNTTANDSFVSFKGLFPSNSSVSSTELNVTVSDNSPIQDSGRKTRRSGRTCKNNKSDKNDDAGLWTRRNDNSEIEPFSRRNTDSKPDLWSRRNNKFEIINEESTNSTKTENEDSKDGFYDTAGKGLNGALVNKNKNSRLGGMILRSNKNSRSSLDNNSRESKSNGAVEDLSLTGHLDVFHVNSPAKPLTDVPDGVLDIMCEDAMFSPIKASHARIKRNNQFPEVPSKRMCVKKPEIFDKRLGGMILRSNKNSRSSLDNNSRESKSNGAVEDLSLTGHLDVFHVNSPAKPLTDVPDGVLDIMCEDAMFSPIKASHARIKRNNQFPEVPSKRMCVKKPEIFDTSKSDTERYEIDPEVLSRRQKQIDYGKNTIGYDNYLKLIPKDKRATGDPKTPPKHVRYSRRAWDGLIKSWRLRLHQYDSVNSDVNRQEMLEKRHSY